MRRRYCMIGWIIGWASLLFCANVGAQSMQLEVVELYTRSADEVIPILEPMLAPGGRITGTGDKLVIRTTPANLEDLRKILATVDAPPRRLLITVRQDVEGQEAARELEVSGEITQGDVTVQLPGKTPSQEVRGKDDGNDIRMRVHSTRSDDSGTTLHTVQVIEGRTAFITLGQSVPVRSRVRTIGPDGITVLDSTEYRDVGAGFYALPRVRGSEVTVELATSADTIIDKKTGAARIERVSSVLRGPLGAWLEVGGVTQNADREHTGITSHRTHAASERRRTYIKVEQIQ